MDKWWFSKCGHSGDMVGLVSSHNVSRLALTKNTCLAYREERLLPSIRISCIVESFGKISQPRQLSLKLKRYHYLIAVGGFQWFARHKWIPHPWITTEPLRCFSPELWTSKCCWNFTLQVKSLNRMPPLLTGLTPPTIGNNKTILTIVPSHYCGLIKSISSTIVN